MPNNLGAV